MAVLDVPSVGGNLQLWAAYFRFLFSCIPIFKLWDLKMANNKLIFFKTNFYCEVNAFVMPEKRSTLKVGGARFRLLPYDVDRDAPTRVTGGYFQNGSNVKVLEGNERKTFICFM